jgi:hypothetical protein
MTTAVQAAVRVLGLMASEEARKALNELATGKAGAWLAAEAAASLTRMDKATTGKH